MEGPVLASVQRILLVAFKFPPYAAVGAKRWTKLCKYLARQGVTIDVLTVDWPGGDPSTLQDVADERIRIHRLPPLALNRLRVDNPTGVLERAKNRFYHRCVRGRPLAQDAALWGPVVIPAAAYIAHRARSQVIVVTGAPFMANYWMARGKRFLPRIPLVQEFRDPWADLPQESLKGQGGIERVRRLEGTVVRAADAIVAVTDGLAEIIRAKPESAPVFTVSNGYDPEDVARALHEPRSFRLIHGGNLYAGRQAPLRAFLTAVREELPSMRDIELIFRGGFPDDVRMEYTDLERAGVLRVLPAIPSADFMVEVQEAFAALQFNAEAVPFLVSTKIFEYGASGRPVLSVNYGGNIDSLVRGHSLGWSVDASNDGEIRLALRATYERWKADSGAPNTPVRLDAFSYDEISRTYLGILGQFC